MTEDKNTAWRHNSIVRAEVGENQKIVITCTDQGTGKKAWTSEVRPYASGRHGFGYDLAPPELIVLDDCLLMDCYGIHYKDGGWGAFSLSRISDSGRLLWTKHWDVHLPTLRRLAQGLLVLHFPKSRFRGVHNPLLEVQLLAPDSGRSVDSHLIDIPTPLSPFINRYGSLSAVDVELEESGDPPSVLITLNDVPGRDPVPAEQRRFATPIPFAKTPWS